MLVQVRPSQLQEWVQSLGDAAGRPIVLDVREAWEVRAAAVPAGEFDVATIPMNEVPARLGELDAQRPVACLCHHGARSLQVAMFLAQQGFENVANVAGGIDAWSREVDAGVPRY